ncbi:hypothetical protein [Catellatospora citrea]|uniref:Uncharacterized protein n=1 Tax=Catellatospora citrea TaxID=53366 RepID=A0A8J3KTJ1_9ACTN|nr:hypothetical protein [Catellatospora citrea]RKE08365.1 hypothetical protein C8E86_3215 [Catellatospora citrea]GIG03159.1 hypothetical protein Cci01nite_82520 [Catellatospora citrea]
MPVQAIASAPADEPGAAWLTNEHPLAGVAARHCASHVHIDPADLVGQVACGSAWAKALTDDLLFALECGLPLEIEPDPFYVDEVAVRRAMRGEELELTELERAEVKRRLTAIRNRRNRPYRFACSHAAATRRETAR